MKTSRRNFFGFGAAIAAAAAVPEIADAKPAEEAVGPMMFEHTCDRGKSRLDAEQLKDHDNTGRASPAAANTRGAAELPSVGGLGVRRFVPTAAGTICNRWRM